MSVFFLLSPLPPEECLVRLRDATDPAGPLSWFGSRPVIGRVSVEFIRLHKRGRYLKQKQYHCELFGLLEEHNGGTMFCGKVSIRSPAIIFLIVGIGQFILVVILSLLGQELTWLLPISLLGVICSILWYGRTREEEEQEKQYLIAFVKTVIEGREWTPTVEASSTSESGS